jgi:hypothetical protein
MTGPGTCRTSGDLRPESAKWAKPDIDQVAVINRDFMSTRPSSRTAYVVPFSRPVFQRIEIGADSLVDVPAGKDRDATTSVGILVTLVAAD